MSPTSPYGRTMYGRCGARSKSALATDRRNVNCMSCVRSLAKLDREFKLKARAWLEQHRSELAASLSAFGFGIGWSEYFRRESVRAIAHEEG